MTDAMTVFDRPLLQARRERARSGYDGFAFLEAEIADRTADRLLDMRRSFDLAVELGARSGAFGRLARESGRIGTLISTDLAPGWALDRHAEGLAVAADEEALPFAEGAFDAVLSNLALHWVNDLPGTLSQIRRMLKPDGLFMASILGGETLVELRDALSAAEIELTGGLSPRVSPFADVRDAGGLLQVGPESAGSDPGPVCYGLGNDRPTVTDCNVVMGRINADRPIGGKLDRLDVEAARAAITKHVAEPLGLDSPEAAAEAVIRVANAKMAGAIRVVSIERGHDPQQFVAVPFGGGGSLHAGALIREVGLKKALVPRYPGVTSAIGCTIADLRQDFVETWNTLVDDLDTGALTDAINRLGARGREVVEGAGVNLDRIDRIVELDMLYVGQTHTVAVPLALADGEAVDTVAIGVAFEAAYTSTYGRLLKGIPMRLMNLRVAVAGRRPRFDLKLLAPEPGGSIEAATTGTRRVYVDGAWHDAAILTRLSLPVGARIPGPAILEQPDTTILIEPGLVGEVDDYGNVLIGEV